VIDLWLPVHLSGEIKKEEWKFPLLFLKSKEIMYSNTFYCSIVRLPVPKLILIMEVPVPFILTDVAGAFTADAG
jgi:hypothetical protein